MQTVETISTVQSSRPEDLLDLPMREQTAGILSFNQMGKWRVQKVMIHSIEQGQVWLAFKGNLRFNRRVRIVPHQPVGISFKHSYRKILFNTEVLQTRSSPATGTMVLVAVPDQIDIIDRRSYYRVPVPASLRVAVAIWPRSVRRTPAADLDLRCVHGILVDLSAGGAQVAVPSPDQDRCKPREGFSFRKGQYVGVRFTPLPYQRPITFAAQVRTVLPTADGTATCLGLQSVGLEASPEGRQTVARIISTVHQYNQMNQSESKGPLA